MSRVHTPVALLAVCAGCRKVRADDGAWGENEAYIREHAEGDLSHGLCPACVREMYPEYAAAILADDPREDPAR